jgi:protein AroM
MLRTVTFLTIGQTPRTDLVPELVAYLPGEVTVRESGALDGLGAEEVAALAPVGDEPRLVTRLRDGRQAVVGKAWMDARLQEILDAAGPDAGTLTVLLCTGAFPHLRAPGLLVDAQHVVDHGVAALCAGMRRIGLLLPLAEQAADFHWEPAAHQEVRSAFASPYEGDRFPAAAAELAACDVIVMHCMGYTEAQRRRVADASGRPVLLARRLVASAVAQLL